MTYDSERGTILIVDDNLGTRAFAKRFLEATGYAVVTAADGAEALRFYAEHQLRVEPRSRTEPQSRIVLLLTDVAMPNMGGVELADHVHAMDSQLPVLFMTGGPWRTYPGSECIAKPFRSAELVARVSRMLNAIKHSERVAPAA
jgi:CheY-like chemotaxis protein